MSDLEVIVWTIQRTAIPGQRFCTRREDGRGRPVYSETLTGARRVIPLGLVRLIGPDRDDDPSVIEVWL